MTPRTELTTEEKWKLFMTLYKNGSNIETLTELLPEFSERKIKNALTYYRYRARRARQQLVDKGDNQERLQTLDKWLNYLDNCHSLEGSFVSTRSKNKNKRVKIKDIGNSCDLLSKTMLYAACYENHHQSDDIEEPNYSEIYRYMSQVLSGEEPSQLRPGSAAKVLEMFDRLNKMVSHADFNKCRTILMNALPSAGKEGSSTDADDPDVSTLLETTDCEVSLFEEGEEDLLNEKLDKDDPYFEIKNLKKMQQLQNENLNIIQNLSKVPGFNPLALQPETVTLQVIKPKRKSVTDKKMMKIYQQFAKGSRSSNILDFDNVQLDFKEIAKIDVDNLVVEHMEMS